MDKRVSYFVVVGSLAVASCGKPDASGVYVSKDNNSVVMIQIVQAKDGAITARAEDISIWPGGTINDQSANLVGATSGHDLIFKPASAWLGGASASGSFTGNSLTFSYGGMELKTHKASLAEFDQDVTQIRTQAAREQRQIAMVQARQLPKPPRGPPWRTLPTK